MDLQNIKPIIETLTADASSEQLRAIMDTAGGRGWDVEFQSYLRSRLNSSKPGDLVGATVLAAAMYGAIPMDLYQAPVTGKIDPFFHRLRKAMLECAELRGKMQDNASRYNFYPEFAAAYPSLRERIAAIAKAHAGMDKGNEELVVLFALGGYFGFKDTQTQMLSALQSAGTTCIMTARGVYAAAGARMFTEARPPKVNTSSGPQMDLGVPTMRTLLSGKHKPENTILRADQEQYGLKGYDNDVPADKPSLQTGDIYYVDGDGLHRQLLRPGLAFAAHVGIVVARSGDTLDTVDGGSGLGGRIDLNPSRNLKFVKGVGWTMDKSGVSFTSEGVNEAEGIIAGLSTTEAVVNHMRSTDARFYGVFLNQYDRMLKDRAKVANDPPKAAMVDKQIALLKSAGHRLIREKVKSGASAQVRTIQGWWKPEQYSEMAKVTRATLIGWLNQIPTVLSNPRIAVREMRL